jgi:predicted glycosyltransferase
MAPPGRGYLSAAGELLRRSRQLRRRIRAHGIKVVLTRNPSGVLATVGTRAVSVFDTDDGRGVGVHYWAARPFADVITSSVHDPEDHGHGHRRYRALKAHMFLHPDHFTPDPEVRRRYLEAGTPLAVVRFSAHDASHDRSITGIAEGSREQLLRLLLDRGDVLLSIERHGLQLLEQGSAPTAEGQPVLPEDFYDLLGLSDVFVGDSQSVAAEAAILGVPSLRLSGFTGRAFYLGLLEEKGLIRNFNPGEESLLIDELQNLLRNIDTRSRASRAVASALNAESDDLQNWFVALVQNALGGAATNAR